jgi:hypothetical protein
MKKLTLLIVALPVLFCSVTASAQHRVGVMGGLNFTNLDADFDAAETDLSSRTLFGLGGVVDLRLSENISLHLEPMYLRKGALATDVEDRIEFPITLSFLELPVFVKAEFGSTAKPYVMAGPTIGYLLSADIEGELSGITFKGDLKDVTESIDLGIGFGAGVSYPVGSASIFLEGRYSLGLSNLQKGGTFELTAGPVSEEITWDKDLDAYKTRGFQIMAGVSFPLGE